jgi:primosomal protein N'
VEERLNDSLTAPRILRITSESIRKKDLRSLLPLFSVPGTIVIGTQILSRLYEVHVNRLVIMGQEEFLWMAGYRAHERAFQTFRNLIDALRPEQVVIVLGKKSLIDVSRLVERDRFYSDELEKRKISEFPPYGRLFLIEVRKKSEAAGERVVHEILERIKEQGLEDRLIGPALDKRGGVHWRMVLKGYEHHFSDLLPWIYSLPDVRIESDPPNI